MTQVAWYVVLYVVWQVVSMQFLVVWYVASGMVLYIKTDYSMDDFVGI